MNISSVRAQLFEATDLPKVLCDLSFQYVDAIELFVENHGKLEGLPVDIQEAIRKQAATCKTLNLRGKNVTWEDLRSISTLFKQLRFLDLQDCPNLQSEQWKGFRPGHSSEHTGYTMLKQTFPYHAALLVQLHEETEILCRHYMPGNVHFQTLEVIYLVTESKTPLVYTASNNENRPENFDSQVVAPYFLVDQDISDKWATSWYYEYSELKSRARPS